MLFARARQQYNAATGTTYETSRSQPSLDTKRGDASPYQEGVSE
jgi:hypothetical protein